MVAIGGMTWWPWGSHIGGVEGSGRTQTTSAWPSCASGGLRPTSGGRRQAQLACAPTFAGLRQPPPAFARLRRPSSTSAGLRPASPASAGSRRPPPALAGRHWPPPSADRPPHLRRASPDFSRLRPPMPTSAGLHRPSPALGPPPPDFVHLCRSSCASDLLLRLGRNSSHASAGLRPPLPAAAAHLRRTPPAPAHLCRPSPNSASLRMSAPTLPPPPARAHALARCAPDATRARARTGTFATPTTSMRRPPLHRPSRCGAVGRARVHGARAARHPPPCHFQRRLEQPARPESHLEELTSGDKEPASTCLC